MKKLVLSLVFLAINLLGLPAFSQTETEPVALGLPGDNFNLYAALDVFQKSKTLEEFERAINEKGNAINNLDLNNDNVIDYVGVVSHKEGNTNMIVLRDVINDKGFQDVAVIEVTKADGGAVFIQVIGDEDLYGKDYIVEPSETIYTTSTPNPGYAYPDNYSAGTVSVGVSSYVNDWPIVFSLFSPLFGVYVSPWYWGNYPTYWNPWRPVYYYDFWGLNRHYYQSSRYRRDIVVRYPHYYSDYYKRRNVSPIVRDYRKGGVYDHTYEGRKFNHPGVPVRSHEAPSRNFENKQLARQQGESSKGSKNRQGARRPQGATSTNAGNQQARRPQGQSSQRTENRQAARSQEATSTNAGNQQATRPQGWSSQRPENRQGAKNQGATPTSSGNPQATRPQGQSSQRPENRQTPTTENRPVAPRENRRQMPTNNPQTAPVNRQAPTQQSRPANPPVSRQSPPQNRPAQTPHENNKRKG